MWLWRRRLQTSALSIYIHIYIKIVFMQIFFSFWHIRKHDHFILILTSTKLQLIFALSNNHNHVRTGCCSRFKVGCKTKRSVTRQWNMKKNIHFRFYDFEIKTNIYVFLFYAFVWGRRMPPSSVKMWNISAPWWWSSDRNGPI